MNQNIDGGRIFQINASDGGVPKLPLRRSEVDVFGLRGDRFARRAVGNQRVSRLAKSSLYGLHVAHHCRFAAGGLGLNVGFDGLQADQRLQQRGTDPPGKR